MLAPILFLSCQKDFGGGINEIKNIANIKSKYDPKNFFKEGPVPGVATSTNTANRIVSDTLDNGDDPIILGAKLNNPYTISNMQRAYSQLYGQQITLTATHLYVRYKPADIDQFKTLIDDSTLELQDYPMDYEVIQDGDYWQDPTLGTEDIGWLYTVVPAGYTPLAGIPYEIVRELYLPVTENYLWESMAESIALGATYIDTIPIDDDFRQIIRTDEQADTLIIANRPPTPCSVNPCEPGCPETWLPDGYCVGGSGTGSGGTTNSRIPSGIITVQDIRTCLATTAVIPVPLLRGRVVCKRWFKIWRGYTDNQGRFTSTKHFKNKVKIIVKSKNEDAKVSKIRGIRFWQIFFPVKQKIGVYDAGDMSHADYQFLKPVNASASNKELPIWVAMTVHNSVQEFRDYTTADGIQNPPSNLKIIVSNWGASQGAGSAPMWAKCVPLSSEFSNVGDYVKFFISYITSSPLLSVLKSQTDMVIGYQASLNDYNCRLNSPQIKSIAYHELGHASHYAQAGCEFWKIYRVRITNEIITTFNGPTAPYGSGNETNAGVVALGEMWGSFCEFFYTDRRYGNGGGGTGTFAPNGAFTAILQNTEYGNNTALNAYLWAIENFNPNDPDDVHSWIPSGLCYDLIDVRNEATNPIIDDQVNSYTPEECFNALMPDVRTVPQFRERILIQNLNKQEAQVRNLFTSYNY